MKRKLIVFARLRISAVTRSRAHVEEPEDAVQGVHVTTALERLDQLLIVREVREHAELDLRVVGAEQHASRRRHKHRTDLAPEPVGIRMFASFGSLTKDDRGGHLEKE